MARRDSDLSADDFEFFRSARAAPRCVVLSRSSILFCDEEFGM
jgi:hypothetical protein